MRLRNGPPVRMRSVASAVTFARHPRLPRGPRERCAAGASRSARPELPAPAEAPDRQGRPPARGRRPRRARSRHRRAHRASASSSRARSSRRPRRASTRRRRSPSPRRTRRSCRARRERPHRRPAGRFLKIVESQGVARQLTPHRARSAHSRRGALRHAHPPARAPLRRGGRDRRALEARDEGREHHPVRRRATSSSSPRPAPNLAACSRSSTTIDVGERGDKLWVQPLHYLRPPSRSRSSSPRSSSSRRRRTPRGRAARSTSGGIVAVDRPNSLVIVATDASYRTHPRSVSSESTSPRDERGAVRVVRSSTPTRRRSSGRSTRRSAARSREAPAAGAARDRAAPRSARVGDPRGDREGERRRDHQLAHRHLVAARLRAIKAVIDALDRPKRQVFIEAVILDVSAEHGLDLGVAWHGGDVARQPNGERRPRTAAFARSLGEPPSSSRAQAFALGVRGPDIPFLNGRARPHARSRASARCSRARHVEGGGHSVDAAHHRERQHAGRDQGAAQHAPAERAAAASSLPGAAPLPAFVGSTVAATSQPDRPAHQGHAAPQRLERGTPRRRRVISDVAERARQGRRPTARLVHRAHARRRRSP